MSQVLRYFHIRHDHSLHGGATVRVVGTPGEGTVQVQVAECSQKDNFCRKTGREVASKKPIKEIRLNKLPLTLFNVCEKVIQRDKTIPKRNKGVMLALWEPDYRFATKYFKIKGSLSDGYDRT